MTTLRAVMGNLAIYAVEQDGDTRLRARGALDLANLKTFRTSVDAAVESSDGDVLLDLCGIELVDSTGLHAMLNVQRRLVKQGRHLRVTCASGPVMRLFELARLVETFDVTVRDARRPGRPGGGAT